MQNVWWNAIRTAPVFSSNYGNECAYGCTFEAALAWTKAFDSTRLTHYESARYRDSKKTYDFSNIDLYSRMYPPLEDIHTYFAENPKKPFVMCEYCHAMGNEVETSRIISK